MSNVRWATLSAAVGFCSVGMLSVAGYGFYKQLPQPLPSQAAAHQSPTAEPLPQASLSSDAAAELPEADFTASYYDKLRKKLVWVPTRVGRETLMTLDHASRVLLAKSAASRARLSDVGLSFMDVYGIINAETSWVPRRGSSKDGTPNVGIAQFEPATARALGVRNADDPVEAIHAAALHMKDAAEWSRDRLQRLNLGKAQRAEKLREGVSIYYNLSSRGRNGWNGLNTASLPVETRRHIMNARLGAQEAATLDAQMRASEFDDTRVLTASNAPLGS